MSDPSSARGRRRAELVEALDRIPVLRGSGGRDLLVDLLRESRGGDVALRDQSTSRLFFVELVSWCERAQAFPDLARAVRLLAAGDPGQSAVLRLTDALSIPSSVPPPQVVAPVEHVVPSEDPVVPVLPGRVRALLVGCAEYRRPDSGLPALPAVRGNLRDLAAVLRDDRLLGLTDDRLTVVADPADADAVLSPLVDAASVEADLLFVYYAGHGVLSDGELRLGLGGTAAGTAAWTGLDGRLVVKEVHRAVAVTKVLVVDCCYSGRLAATQTDPGSVIENRLEAAGVVTLASSAADAVSYSPEGEPLTAFTGELVSVLRDGVAGGGPVLTVDTVFAAVRARLRRRGLPEPRMLHSDRAGRAALVRNRRWDGPPSDRE